MTQAKTSAELRCGKKRKRRQSSKLMEETLAWQIASAKSREAYGLSAVSRHWSSRPHIVMKGIHPADARGREMVELAWAGTCISRKCPFSDDTHAVGLFVDFSQAHDRGKFGKLSDLALTRISAPKIYSFSHDRCFRSNDLFKLMGWPRPPRTVGIPDDKVFDMLGESFSLPVIASVLYPMLLSVPIGNMWKGSE